MREAQFGVHNLLELTFEVGARVAHNTVEIVLHAPQEPQEPASLP